MYREEWSYCTSYAEGDIVTRSEHLWRAKRQNAGKDPANADNSAYWEDMGVFAAAGAVRHDDTLEKCGTSDSGFYHLSKDEAEAAVNAYQPGADNPFVTESRVPELAQSLGSWRDVGMPSGIGMIYDCYYDDDEKLLVVVGDGRIAWLDTVELVWESQPLAGAWRSVCKFGAVYVAVGKDVFAHGALGHMVAGVLEGNWQAVEAGSAGVLAAADGLTAYSLTGVDGWTVKNVAVGYGEAIAYDEANAVFSLFGRAGRLVGDGVVFSVDAAMPKGTWRAGIVFDGAIVALSGKGAHKVGEGAWQLDDMPEGGWFGVAHGGGYIVGVGDGICGISRERAFDYSAKPIANYVYKAVEYGNGRFWVVGSSVQSAGVFNAAEAIREANDPNGDNPFATIADIRDIVNEAMTVWGGNNV